VHFLQIWLLPKRQGVAPGYAQKAFTDEEKRGKLRLVASPDGAEGSLSINSDAKVYAGLFDAGEVGELAIAKGHGAWIHVARGKVRVNGKELGEGDGAQIEEEGVRIEGVEGGEVVAFDLG